MIAIEHDFPFDSARQLSPSQKTSWIVVWFVTITITVTKIFVAIAEVIIFAIEFREVSPFNLRHLDVADVIVAVTWIQVKHRVPRRQRRPSRRSSPTKRLWEVVGRITIRDRLVSD